MRSLLILATLLLLSGCSMFGNGVAACNERQPYQGSAELPPLKVPDGVGAPDTRGALKIPDLAAATKPRTAQGCLDEPPAYLPQSRASAASSPPVTGAEVPAAPGGVLEVGMDEGRQWETRLGVTYQTKANADFEGGTTAEFASSTGFMAGIGYDLSRYFEIGANFSYDRRDYHASVAGDDPGEVFPVSGTLDSMGAVLDLTYNLMSGPFTPFVVAGVGWNWVDTRIATEPPQVGCWWNPWYGYVCTTFQDTKTVDGLSYQVGAGLRYHLHEAFSLSGSYRMSWVNFPKATSTPTFDGFSLVLGWRF